MKLYGSDTSEHVNGSSPSTDPDEPLEDEFEGSEADYSVLFTAPNYSDFIKIKPNARAKTYELRVASMMKAGLVFSLQNHQFADAATFLKHGPGVATAAGNLAAEDARAAKLIEMLTAPESPYVMFALVAMPFIGQLFRNHQDEAKKAAGTWRERRAEKKAEKREGIKPNRSAPITVKLFRREFKLPIRLKLRLPNVRNVFKAFLAPTQYPDEITQEVFNDISVIKALHKMGIYPREDARRDENAA